LLFRDLLDVLRESDPSKYFIS